MSRRVKNINRAFFRAVKQGNLMKAWDLSDFQSLTMDIVNGEGQTPLVCAAAANFSAVAVRLAQRRKNLDQADKKGCNALDYAIFYGDTGLVRWLLYGKADPNAAGGAAVLPLIAAQAPRRLEIFNLLRQHPGIDLDRRDVKTGDTAVTYALRKGGYIHASLLLESGASTDAAAPDGLCLDTATGLPESLTQEIEAARERRRAALISSVRNGRPVSATKSLRWRAAP